MQHIWRLRHFLDIAESGSFHAAAKLKNISQPALSKSIQILEDQIGARLFTRTTTGIVLTDAGRMLARHAKIIEKEWNSSLIEINARSKGKSGKITLGAGPMYSLVSFPNMITKITDDYPNLHISLLSGVGSKLIPALKAGKISLYAGALPSLEDRLSNDFETIFLRKHNNALVASKNHPLFRQEVILLEDLLNYPWLKLIDDQESSDNILTFFTAHGLQEPQNQVETQSIMVALKLISKEHFIASLPEDLTKLDGRNDIKNFDFPDYNWKIRTGITFRKTMLELEPFQNIIEILQQQANTEWFDR